MREAGYLGVICSVIMLLMVSSSMAADYPTKPITVISPMAPGGGHDLVARGFGAVADKILDSP